MSILGWSFVVAGLGLCLAYWRRRSRAQDPGPPLLNAPIPAPTSEFTLSCPHCGLRGPLETLALVGETVECPLCEEPFLVLEPTTPDPQPPAS